jgi:hypothetical protein
MSYMREVDDGIITGTILQTKHECSHCGNDTICILIRKITLPVGIEPFPRLILYEEVPDPNDDGSDWEPVMAPIIQIGISCNCYAKAHRQIAYLSAWLKERNKSA